MKRYELQIRNAVKNDIDQIKDFIVEKNSRENAERYAAELYAEAKEKRRSPLTIRNGVSSFTPIEIS